MIQDGIELQLGTNHMGPYLLSHLLRPRLKNSGQGRLSAKSSIPLSHMHWFQNIQIDSFLPRIVYLTNLDYRQGLINFEDLNSDRSYDPATAFYQVNFRVALSLTEVFSEPACQYPCSPVAVEGVSRGQGNVQGFYHSLADYVHPLDHGLCSLSGSL